MQHEHERLIGQARKCLDPFVARLAARREVEGIVLLSSIVSSGQRVTFDEFSDIDMTVWVRAGMRPCEWRPDPRATRRLLADRLPAWLGNFSFHLPLPWGRVEVNVHQRVFEYDTDPRTTWDDGIREAHAYTAEVVFDRAGLIQRLLDEKTRMGEEERRDRLIRLASRLEWDVGRSPGRMVRRGDVAAGHYMLSAAIDELIELLYVLAGRFVPHRKWRLDGLLRHGLATSAELGLIMDALRTGELTETEFQRRVQALQELWEQLRPRLPAEVARDTYHIYSATVSANRQLRAQTTADQALARYGATLGPQVYDLVNYLVPDDLRSLAAALSEDTIVRLPGAWRYLAHELARHLSADDPPEDAG